MTAEAWDRALLATALLAVDPAGLGGMVVRSRAGPVRDRLLDRLALVSLPLRRLASSATDTTLFGGADPAATLASGSVVRTRGIIGETPQLLVLTMAERMSASQAARLVRLFEAGHAAVALDEGASADEIVPGLLLERLALHVDLDAIPMREAAIPPTDHDVARARTVLSTVDCHAAIPVLATIAVELCVPGLRAPWLALRAARASAALAGRAEVADPDIAAAVSLVIAPRATAAPAPDEAPQQREEEPHEDNDAAPATNGTPEETLLQAARTAVPRDLLDRLTARRASRGAGTGAGQRKKAGQRGRPLASRPGRPSSGDRIDVHATLCAAAPWQAVRRQQCPDAAAPILVRPQDLRIRRFEERAERLLIFVVDASGSAAQARLAEAKGAVEILLAEAYSRRDQVALVAFRGACAETLLPPTRSLARARKRLSGQPAGGATPLAHGLRAALAIAETARARGTSAAIALLTDGRANIALDGTPNRKAAGDDAMIVARALRAMQIPSVVLDIGGRRDSRLMDLAAALDASCIPLPRADAGRISAAVGAELDLVR